MSTSVSVGPIAKGLTRDSEGHRDYMVRHLVRATDPLDGPETVMNTPGLPQIGALWNFGNDTDVWAFCWPDMKIKPHKISENDAVTIWSAEQKFSTRPLSRCQDETIEDPLLEPDRVSGGFFKYTREVTEDRFGDAIQSSSFETLRGPQVEFDHNRPTVRIGQNVPNLELEVFTPMVDTLNDDVLWGLPARQIKLSNVSWSRRLFGICDFYFTRDLEFDIDTDTFDKTAVDEGTKALHGHWVDDTWTLLDIGGSPPDPSNPAHFSRYKDRNGENTRVLLDGAGQPLNLNVDTGTGGTDPTKIDIEHYKESNFLLLGIPADLEAV